MNVEQLERSLDNYFHHTALNAEIKHWKDLIFEYENQFDTLNGMQYTDMPHNPTPQDGVLNTICRIDDKASHYKERIAKSQRRIDRMNSIDEQIEDALPKLGIDDYEIIAMARGQSKEMSWGEISSHFRKPITANWAKKMYKRALINLLKIMGAVH